MCPRNIRGHRALVLDLFRRRILLIKPGYPFAKSFPSRRRNAGPFSVIQYPRKVIPRSLRPTILVWRKQALALIEGFECNGDVTSTTIQRHSVRARHQRGSWGHFKNRRCATARHCRGTMLAWRATSCQRAALSHPYRLNAEIFGLPGVQHPSAKPTPRYRSSIPA